MILKPTLTNSRVVQSGSQQVCLPHPSLLLLLLQYHYSLSVIITRQMMIIVGASLSAQVQVSLADNCSSAEACLCAALSFASFSCQSALLCRSAVSLSMLHRTMHQALSRCWRLRNRSPLCSSVSLSSSLLRHSHSSYHLANRNDRMRYVPPQDSC